MLNRLPDNKLEELLDYITFLSSRYSHKAKRGEQEKNKVSLVDFFRDSPLYGSNIDLTRDREMVKECQSLTAL